MSSILIFDINKKYLLYKILNKDILKLLTSELNKKYGEEIDENQALSPVPEIQEPRQEEVSEEQEPKLTTKNLLTDDFIYGYFAPIINSFEISKEMNYEYEYALFNDNQYIIRFTLYDNCLLLCIYNSNSSGSVNSNNNPSQQQAKLSTILRPMSTVATAFTQKQEPTSAPQDLNKLIYNDYYTNWCSKSIITLIKYKFGICSDERCFNEIDNELKNLFVKWTRLHSSDIIYYIEAIEYLQVNDETRLKCDQFIKEFIRFLNEQEQIRFEFDYLEDEGLLTNDAEDENDDAANFPGQNIKDDEHTGQYIDEIEDFYDEIGRINYYILSYGTKMLFKHDALGGSGDEFSDRSSQSQTSQILDSSSLFMILLEAATFLNCSVQALDMDESIYSFRTPASSPSPVSVDENLNDHVNEQASSLHLDSKFRNGSYGESFQSVKSTSTPMFSQVDMSSPLFKSPIDELKEMKIEEMDNEAANNSLNQSKLPDNRNSYKKTHCFLRNSNKSYNFYDVLFIKLDENLCFTQLKLSKLSKYCELITDLDTYLNELLIILNRKRLILTNIEMNARLGEATKSAASSASLQQQQQQQQQDETDEMKFLSVFINKLITFYEKLQLLKNDLNIQIQLNSKLSSNSEMSSSSSTITALKDNSHKIKLENRKKIGQNLFKFNFSLRQRFNIGGGGNGTSKQNHAKKARFSHEQQMIEEARLKHQLKLANNLQMKINQLIKNKQFIPSLNLHAMLAAKTLNINQLLNNYRNIETQVIQLKENLKDLLFDVFLNDKFSSKKRIHQMNQQTPSTTPSASSTTSVFQLNSKHFMNSVRNYFKTTSLNLYTSFMDVKMKRNLAMSYYWHLLPGLVHFAFINRQDNNCIVPTVEACSDFEIHESSINQAYRKYVPIIITFLYKYDCTQFQFVDSSLRLVINYFIWFEDKNANYIPVDLNTSQQQQQQQQQRSSKSETNEKLLASNRSQQHSGAYFNFDPKAHYPIGITLKSYYDLLRKLCYPNAPNESLSCYELICLHSITLDERLIKDQCERLASNLSQLKKNK